MGLFLGIIVIIPLTGVVLVNVLAIRYYAGAYAKATRRGFVAVVRDPHAREVYRLSRRLAAWGDGDRNRLLFDVALPRDGAPTVRADTVLVSPRGLGVFCVQEGRGSAYGDAGDGHWIVVGSAKRDGSERMVPNLGARVSEVAAALRGYLSMDATTTLPVATCAVFSDAVDVDHVEVAEEVTLSHVRDVSSPLDEALPVTADEEGGDTAPSFDDADLKRRYRALRACANMPDVDADGEGAILSFERSDRLEPTAWLRGAVRREHEESTVAEIVRKADRLASSKEDFDALTWERVLEISNRMEGGGDAERRSDTSGGVGETQGKMTDWNEQAAFYDKFVFCELEDTATYLDVVGIEADDTVLDVCCGPGRVSVLAAARAKSVTAIDSAEKMLSAAQDNAARRGLSNVTFRLLDWECVLPGQNVGSHDVVIASRCQAMMDVEKLSALARRKVAVQIFADAPSIPALLGVLYSGCGTEGERPGRNGSVRKPEGTSPRGPQPQGVALGPEGRGRFGYGGPGSFEGGRARSAYIDIVNRVYGAGFDPNVRILPERFRKTFPSREEAVRWVCSIKPERAEGHEARVAMNVAPFLTEKDGGVEFCIATKAAIIWWEVRGL